MMAEYPIIFNGEEVRAYRAGLKTSTRCPVQNPDHYACLTGDCQHGCQSECAESLAEQSPWGKPGDSLVIQEAVATDGPWNIPSACNLWYPADGDGPRSSQMRSAVNMPRWACRSTPLITDIRAERVQDIEPDDCEAEGIKQRWTCIDPGLGSYAHDNDVVDDFHATWDSLYAAKGRGWNANEWVWVIGFERFGG